MEDKGYHKIMGVERSASADELKKAHRQLARKYHPDVNQEKDAEVRFKDLSEAYEVLSDPDKRAAYDQLGQHWKAGTGHTSRGFDWASKGDRTSQGAGFCDFFETLISRGFATPNGPGTDTPSNRRNHRQTFSAKGENHHAKILIDFEDVYSGSANTSGSLVKDRRVQTVANPVIFILCCSW